MSTGKTLSSILDNTGIDLSEKVDTIGLCVSSNGDLILWTNQVCSFILSEHIDTFASSLNFYRESGISVESFNEGIDNGVRIWRRV